MIQSRTSHPKGATSLLVVVGLAMLLMVIVTGLTVLSIRESRQALNTDLSNRALAAATATARDAAQILNTNPDLQVTGCTGATAEVKNAPANLSIASLQKPVLSNSADANKAEIVCRTITSIGNTLPYQIEKDNSVVLYTYLPNGTPVNRMELLWGDGTNPTQLTPFSGTAFPASLPNSPAAMEISLVYWGKTSDPGGVQPGANGNSLPVATTVLLPTNSGTPNPSQLASRNYQPSTDCNGGHAGANGVIYTCRSLIELAKVIDKNFTDVAANTNNIAVLLKPRYRAGKTPVQARFFNGDFTDSKLVDVQSTIATIDITAKVGNLYRRIQAQKPIGGSSFITDVLYSNASICKNLKVHEDFTLVSGNNCN